MQQYHQNDPTSTILNSVPPSLYEMEAPARTGQDTTGLPGGASAFLPDEWQSQLDTFRKSIYGSAWDKIFPDRAVLPNGFIDSPISSTKIYRVSKQERSHEFYSQFNSVKEYDQWQRAKTAKRDPEKFLNEHEQLLRDNSKRSIYRIGKYRSGELTGNIITTGREGKTFPPVRRGSVETVKLSNRGKTKIRQAIECSTDKLKYFITLTFDPKKSELNDAGNVDQKWAKRKLHRLLDALTKISIRKHKSTFDYLWIAENQRNGNIHFHILWNQFFTIATLNKLWDQASNSVDTKTLQNIHHAKRYVMKYISKDQKSTIQGNRYAITDGLRVRMEPVCYVIEDQGQRREIMSIVGSISRDIESMGGYATEWGFSLPMPERPRRTPQREYSGIPRSMANSLLDVLLGEVPF